MNRNQPIVMWVGIAVVVLVGGFADAGPAEDRMLFEAIRNLDRQAVVAALDKGANPNALPSTRLVFTPLSQVGLGVAVQLAQLSIEPSESMAKGLAITEILFERGAELGRFDREICIFPIMDGDAKTVSLLLDKGASATAKIDGLSPTEIEIQHSQKEIYDLLVQHGGLPVSERVGLQLVLVQACYSFAGTGNAGGSRRGSKDR